MVGLRATVLCAVVGGALGAAKFEDSWEKFCGVPDCYTELGLLSNATKAQIRRQYRALSLEFHPDKHPGDATALERFNRIGRANEVLTDDAQRKKLDYYTENPDEYWSLYGTYVKVHYAPKTDIRFALFLILCFISCVQPALQLSKHQMYVKTLEKACLNRLPVTGGGSAESVAIRAEADERVKVACAARKKEKKTKLTSREERELLQKTVHDLVVASDLPAEYAYPTFKDVLIVKLLRAPVEMANESKRKKDVAKRVAEGGALTEDEQQELMEQFLGGADEWDTLTGAEQDSMFEAKAYTKSAFDAWRAKNPRREPKAAELKSPSKKDLRQRKKGAPRFVMDD